MCEVPLTHEQSIFAAEHHGLIYKFLVENNLSRDEYYDVVVFSYLKSVRDYFDLTSLRQYSFATIAWKNMSRSVADYKRKLRRKKDIEIISIHAGINEGDQPLEDTLPATDDLILQLEMELLLHDLAAHVSKQQMDMIRLRRDGYGIRDVARSQNLSLRHAKALLEEARIILLKLCNE